MLDLGVVFQEIDIEGDPDAAQYIQQLNRGERLTPTLIIGNGLFRLTQPSLADLELTLRRIGYHF